MNVLHNVLTRRLKVRKERYPVRHSLEVINREVNANRVGDSDQVKDGVGRPSQDHSKDDGVLERFAGHDIARTDVLLEHGAHSGADGVALVLLLLVRGGGGGGTGEGHAHNLGGGSHRVGGVHACGAYSVNTSTKRAWEKEKRTSASTSLLPARPTNRLKTDLLRLSGGAHLDILAVRLERRNDVEDGLVGARTGLHRSAVDCEKEGDKRKKGSRKRTDAPMIPGRLRRPRAIRTPGLGREEEISVRSPLFRSQLS